MIPIFSTTLSLDLLRCVILFLVPHAQHPYNTRLYAQFYTLNLPACSAQTLALNLQRLKCKNGISDVCSHLLTAAGLFWVGF